MTQERWLGSALFLRDGLCPGKRTGRPVWKTPAHRANATRPSLQTVFIFRIIPLLNTPFRNVIIYIDFTMYLKKLYIIFLCI